MAEPKRLSDLLGGILRQVRAASATAEVATALAEAVGPQLAGHCQVSRMTKGRLTVEVDSAPLFAELAGFRKEATRLAINARLQRDPVAEIVFCLGSMKHV